MQTAASPWVCEECGLEVEHGADGCRSIFERLIARDFSDALYFSVHRMVVDTYSLQHPERYCRSAKSLAAHLCGLCQILDGEASAAVGDEALRRWLNGRVGLTKPVLPSFRGQLTIADVDRAKDPSAYAEAARRWARPTWEAYAPLHDLARGWFHLASSR